ncbi:MAG: hypothetical protein ABI205_00755 [Gemmatimonadaceae bacterium]
MMDACHAGAALLLATAACRAAAPTARVCAGSATASDPVPYSTVDLGRRARGGIPYIEGPAIRAVVRSDSEWTRTWRAIADSVPRPQLDFRDSIVVVVASRVFTSGPVELNIEDVYRCRGDSAIVVSVRLHEHENKQDYGDRRLSAVELSRSAVGERFIRFIDLPTVTDR